ncbi:MAG: NADPH-dependent glutamate synthase [Clostridia bacterium]|nr:NADPH-dependent glutamate synthase [Clostridia bacterium]
MPNMDPKKNPMPTQPPLVRAHNFDEVALGYSEEQALSEAARCLNCKTMPCVAGCPVNIHIPAFIQKVREGNFEGAYRILAESSSLPAVCGRVCPQETQCESKCVRGIKGEPVGIGRLERFVADWHNEHSADSVNRPTPNGHKVAVVGSGPSGLTCAGDLAKKGYEVTVFEALHLAGGVLVYGIPEFRLPKDIVRKEVETLKQLGVRIETNMVIGKTLTVDELFAMGYEAVFIGSGAGLPRFMGIPGEGLKGVYSANEFLTRSNLMKAYLPHSATPIQHAKRVAVVGGGNVAMDAARTALRLGAEHVYIVYRRSMEELPARKEEVEHAEEEGVEFLLLCNPTEILGYRNTEDKRDPKNGTVTGIRCVRMELGEPDASGRRSPVEIPNSEFTLDVDCVIMSIGTSPNPLIKSTTEGLEVNRKGGIVVNEFGLTSRPYVYAGGDAVTGAATVILAMGAGKTAASAIDNALSGEED